MLNILVVDDEEDAGTLYKQQFRRAVKSGEVSLHIALSGFEALDLLATLNKERPLVILSDINMPGMSGLELLKKIKTAWPDLKVIMVSAYFGNVNYLNEANSLGADDFISKPINFDEVKLKLKL